MRILVVEDDKYKRKRLKDILEKENLDLVFKKAITPALQYIRYNSSHIDGIILDLDLPGYDSYYSWKTIIVMGGLYIPKEMNRLKLDIPILINSSDAFNVKYDDYIKDSHNIKAKVNPSNPNYKADVLSFIKSIEKGEF